MKWITQHKLLFILVIGVVAVGIWFGLSSEGAPEPLLTTSAADGSTSLSASDQEIIGTLLSLRAVTLSGSIFQNPAFLTLQDFGTTIVPEPVGRENPFAPLGSQTAAGAAGAGAQTGGANRGAQLFTPRP